MGTSWFSMLGQTLGLLSEDEGAIRRILVPYGVPSHEEATHEAFTKDQSELTGLYSEFNAQRLAKETYQVARFLDKAEIVEALRETPRGVAWLEKVVIGNAFRAGGSPAPLRDARPSPVTIKGRAFQRKSGRRNAADRGRARSGLSNIVRGATCLAK